MLGEATGKVIFFLGDQITHFKIVCKFRAFMKFTGWIDHISLFTMPIFSTPLSGSGKVFESKTNRINLAVTGGTLWFLLVCEYPFPGGQGFVGQS